MIIYGSDDPGAIVYIKHFLLSSKYKTKQVKKIENLKTISKKINFLITGSALGNTLDKKIISWGKRKKLTSISIIEHWTFFKKRFYFNKKNYYPDFIFVNDNYAKKLAIIDGLPPKKIFVSGNNYLKKIIKQKKESKIKIKNNKNILFISEPMIESHSSKILSKFGYNEFNTLDLIIKNKPKDWGIVVKLHPREKMTKYLKYINKVKFLRIKNHENIVQNFNIIIGMTSMLLLELGIYRNDIISLRLKSSDAFIGGNLGLTKNITKEKHLIECFNKKPKNNNKKFIKSINSIKVKADELLELISK